jgi:hypothetical protein
MRRLFQARRSVIVILQRGRITRNPIAPGSVLLKIIKNGAGSWIQEIKRSTCMKSRISLTQCPFTGVIRGSFCLSMIAMALIYGSSTILKAQNLYISYGDDSDGIGIIGEYGLDGSIINPALISDNQPPIGNPVGLAISGTNLFVANYSSSETIGEYGLDGSTVNAALITEPGYVFPVNIAISGTNLFIANENSGTIAEYTTAGQTVNAALISGLNFPWGIAISGTNLFVASFGPIGDEQGTAGTIGEYTTSGKTINASLISGLDRPLGIAISGNNLFVASYTSNGTIGEYGLDGSTINASLISDTNEPNAIAISGNDLFVANAANGTIGEYTLSGATVNASLISGLGDPFGITISPGPPTLGINRSGNTVTIDWRAVSGWNLEQNTNIGTANWVSSGLPVTTANGTNYVNIVSPSGNLFFRLQGP